MRIDRIEVRSLPPIGAIQLHALPSFVAFAGKNGTGKTRLIRAIAGKLSGPLEQMSSNKSIALVLRATNSEEAERWGADHLNTDNVEDVRRLYEFLQQPRTIESLQSVVLYLQPGLGNRQAEYGMRFQPSLDDPRATPLSWYQDAGQRGDYTLSPLSIILRAHAWEQLQESHIQKLKSTGHLDANVALRRTDPFTICKNIFGKLFPEKELNEPRPDQSTLTYKEGDQELPLTSLSSGEARILDFAFQMQIRELQHSIIIHDEPELHLHPILAERFVALLTSLGRCNQYICATHSPEIISLASRQRLVIIRRSHNEQTTSPAIVVSGVQEAATVLDILGRDIGRVALGSRFLMVEGKQNSWDTAVYGRLIEHGGYNLQLRSVSDKSSALRAAMVHENVLKEIISGMRLYAIVDRDFDVHSETMKLYPRAPDGNIYILGRYHLENYFLEEDILAQVVEHLTEASGRFARFHHAEAVRDELRKIAKQKIQEAVVLSMVAKLRMRVGNFSFRLAHGTRLKKDELRRAVLSACEEERCRINRSVSPNDVDKLYDETYDLMERSIIEPCSESWKREIPGKMIIIPFCSLVDQSVEAIRKVYLNVALQRGASPFDDIKTFLAAVAR